MKKIFTKGFTLLEILVVISIIGILTSLALLSFEPAQKRARDTQRKSDLKQFQTSLEGLANENDGYYPSLTSVNTITSTFCDILEIEGTCPTDPKEGRNYYYISNGTGLGVFNATEYVLWGSLEMTDNYWVICSSGKTGSVDTEPSTYNCPAEL